MPNLIGEDRSTVESLVSSYGFRNVSYKEEYSDQEEGTVISQSIRSGTSIIPSEESLEIVVSKGRNRLNPSKPNDSNGNNSGNTNNNTGGNRSGRNNN